MLGGGPVLLLPALRSQEDGVQVSDDNDNDNDDDDDDAPTPGARPAMMRVSITE